MKKLKTTILIMILCYAAGFLTAIYGLAPVDQPPTDDFSENAFSSFTKSDQFALELGRQLKNITCFAEDTAVKTGSMIQDKMAVSKN